MATKTKTKQNIPVREKSSEKIARLACGLDIIGLIALDYDGETTIKGLKGLVDELKSIAVETLNNERKLPPKFSTWKEYAEARGLIL